MGIIKKQAINNTVISYTGAILGYINFLILLPYAFLPEQIGLVRVIQSAASLFVPLAQLGIITSVIRYFPYFKEEHEKKQSFFLYSILVTLAGFLLFSLAFLIFDNQIIDIYSQESPLFIEYYYLIIPLTFFLIFFGLMEAFANSNYKTAAPIFLRDVVLRILTAILIILFIYGFIDFPKFVWLLVIAYGIILLGLSFYLKTIGELKISFEFSFLKGGFFKKIFSYSIYVLLVSTGAIFISYIDILMIGAIIGLAPVGIYATAYFMAVVIDIPRRSIKQIVDPFVSEAIKNEDYGLLKDLYKKVSINQLIIGLFLILGIWGNIDEIYEIMPNGQIYVTGKYVVLIIMLAKLIDMATSINGEIIGYSKYFKFNTFSIYLLSALAVITNLIFIPIYGINGAAAATLISLLLFNIIKFIFVLTKFKIQPFTNKTALVILIASFTYGIIYYLIPDTGNKYLNVLLNSSVIVLLYPATIYYLKISEDFNISINKFFSRFN